MLTAARTLLRITIAVCAELLIALEPPQRNDFDQWAHEYLATPDEPVLEPWEQELRDRFNEGDQ